LSEAPDGRLLETLKRFVTDPEEWRKVVDGAPLLEAAGLDSLSVLNLVTELELLFEVRFDEASLGDALQSVQALDAFLKAPRSAPPEVGR
jgi:acyl carrier protein